ncbi:MAG: hypothetical protein AB7S74_07305 [Hyphomicrobium sp.]
MTDWKQGGWTGSINRYVRREISKHFHENADAKRARYSLGTALLHRIFDHGTFWRFIALYAFLLLLVGIVEFAVAACLPHLLPRWTADPEIKPLLTNVASYLITAQVGVLGVVSIAVGLVTIIAQHENASTDVQVYYHESLAFGVVASSIALLAVLCAQLLWPFQFTLHWFGHGTGSQFFKIVLTTTHICWLLLNLCGMAQFVATTLAFVQQKAREVQRERYTANVVVPEEMRKNLREQLFLMAGPEFVNEACPHATGGTGEPAVYLGSDFSGAGDIEVSLSGRKGVVLTDVRMVLLRWVVCRWLSRCMAASNNQQQFGGIAPEPLLLFPPQLDVALEPDKGLCRRSGGLPLTKWERWVLRRAFKFRRKRNDT